MKKKSAVIEETFQYVCRHSILSDLLHLRSLLTAEIRDRYLGSIDNHSTNADVSDLTDICEILLDAAYPGEVKK